MIVFPERQIVALSSVENGNFVHFRSGDSFVEGFAYKDESPGGRNYVVTLNSDVADYRFKVIKLSHNSIVEDFGSDLIICPTGDRISKIDAYDRKGSFIVSSSGSYLSVSGANEHDDDDMVFCIEIPNLLYAGREASEGHAYSHWELYAKGKSDFKPTLLAEFDGEDSTL